MVSSNKSSALKVATTLLILLHGRTLMPLAPLVPEWDWASDHSLQDANKTILLPAADDGNSTSSLLQTFPRMSLKLIILSSAYVTTDIVVSQFAGKFGDYLGFDVALLVGLVAAFAMIVLLIFSSSFVSILVAHFVQGVALAFILPIGLARILRIYPAGHRYNHIAVASTQISMGFSTFGSTLSGFFIEYFGQRGCFLAMVPFNIALIFITLLQYCLDHDSGERGSADEDTSELESKDNAAAPPSSPVRSFRDILTDYQVIIITGAFTVCFLHKSALEPTIGFWLASKFGAGAELTGLIWGLGGIVIIPANVISAYFAKLYPDWIWLYAMINLAVCMPLIVSLPHSSSTALAAFAVVGYMYCAVSARYSVTLLLSVLVELRYPYAYGRIMAIANFGITLPYLIGPLFAVPLINHVSFQVFCLCTGTLYIVYPGLLVFLRRITTDERCYDEEREHILMSKIQDN